MGGFARGTSSGLRWCVLPAALVAIGVACGWAGLVIAADSELPAEAPGVVPAAGAPLQESDDVAAALTPVEARDAAGQARVEATAKFLAGRLLENRNDTKGAFQAYQEAIERDPKLVDAYKAIVPLAFRLDMMKQGLDYAIKAVELDPTDSDLLRTLGVQMASQNRVGDAIKYLEQAAASPAVLQESAIYVLLMRDLGILYGAIGEKEKAGKAFAKLFEAMQDPNRYELDFRTKSALLADPRTNYERIGQVLIDAGNIEQGSEAIELAAKSGRATAGNLSFYRAKLLLLKNQPEEALTELQKYLDAQRQTRGRDAYDLLSQILLKLNRGGDLLPQLKALAEDDSRNLALQYYLADHLLSLGEVAAARGVYEESLKGSADGAGYIGLARVLIKQQDAEALVDVLARGLQRVGEEGVDEFETLLEDVAKEKELVQKLIAAAEAQAATDPPTITFERSYITAKLAGEIEAYDEAISLFQKALELNRDRAATVYGDMGEMLIRNKRFAQAAKVYEDASRDRTLADKRPNYLYLLSQVRELSGETELALEAVNEALKVVPDAPLLHYQKGWIYFHAKEYDKAVEQLKNVIKNYPGVREVVRRSQFTLSSIYVFQGELRKGEEVLEEILEEEPDDPSVNNDLGYLYADQNKNLEQAEKMIRKAIAAEPTNPAYLDSMGWIMYRLAKYAEAEGYLEKAVGKRTAGDATILDHLADCQIKLGKTPQAIENWNKALDDLKEQASPDPELKSKIEAKIKAAKGDGV